jgi:hypothetical protein
MDNLIDVDLTPAKQWYKAHRNHIDHLIDDECIVFSYPPSYEDASKPYLWKPEHWKWFLEKQI